jgi:TetR/AcrR family transcriptional repressor of nem operon
MPIVSSCSAGVARLLIDRLIYNCHAPKMARPREFDRDFALKSAIQAFSEHGYEGTSTDELLQVMKISRQSLYNAFGDKRRLYIEALQDYIADSVAGQIRTLNRKSSPLKGIEALLNDFIARSHSNCLGLFAIFEFGQSDPDVTLIGETAGRSLHIALERRIAEAKAAGEIDPEVDPGVAARFIAAILSGLKVAARAGAPTEDLQNIARMALRGLT